MCVCLVQKTFRSGNILHLERMLYFSIKPLSCGFLKQTQAEDFSCSPRRRNFRIRISVNGVAVVMACDSFGFGSVAVGNAVAVAVRTPMLMLQRIRTLTEIDVHLIWSGWKR